MLGHLIAAGIDLTGTISPTSPTLLPLCARIYPNGLADVNHFHAAGGMGFLIGELLDAGLLHDDVRTVAGERARRLPRRAEARCGRQLVWEPVPRASRTT